MVSELGGADAGALWAELRARQTRIQLSTGGRAFMLPCPPKLPRSRVPGRPKPMPYLAPMRLNFLSVRGSNLRKESHES